MPNMDKDKDKDRTKEMERDDYRVPRRTADLQISALR